MADSDFQSPERTRTRRAVMDLLKELHATGSTLCMVTHDERYAGYASRTVHLYDGRVTDGDA